MRVDENRLRENFYDISKIGINENNGVDRTAFSESFYVAREKLKFKMENAKLATRIDCWGNLFGVRKGLGKSTKKILIGSHLDTVPNGGLYDGCLGIMTALECIDMLNDNHVMLKNDLEIVALNAEEGDILGGTLGSRGILGLIDTESDNFNVASKTYGINGNDIKKSLIKKEDIKCFIELHIEQGKILEAEKKNIGIVEGIVGIRRYKIVVKGEANHAGTTRMDHRDDALVKSIKIIEKVNKLALKEKEKLVATIGKYEVFPNSVNIIPGKVEMVLEIRSLENEIMDKYIREIRYFCETVKGTALSVIIEKQPVILNEDIIGILEKTAIKNQIRYKRMVSGAGHDAKTMAEFTPTGMIFLPSIDGISHSPKEKTLWGDIIIGTKLFYETLSLIDRCEI